MRPALRPSTGTGVSAGNGGLGLVAGRGFAADAIRFGWTSCLGRLQPLVKRQACLLALLERFGCPAVSPSEPFKDGLALLRVAEERGLEGVVSKRRDAPYRSGECRDWRKVKTAIWREANRERWRLFE